MAIGYAAGASSGAEEPTVVRPGRSAFLHESLDVGGGEAMPMRVAELARPLAEPDLARLWGGASVEPPFAHT